jgi:hypothetical protein
LGSIEASRGVRRHRNSESHQPGQHPWERSKLARLRPGLSLADLGLEENAGQQLAATFSPSKAEGSSSTQATALPRLGNAQKRARLPRFAISANRLEAIAGCNRAYLRVVGAIAKVNTTFIVVEAR